MKKVLVTTSSFGKNDKKPLELLASHGIEVTVNPYGRTLTEAESLELLPGFQTLIAGTEKLNQTVLQSASDLQFICRLGAGMDSVDQTAAAALGIRVDNTPNAHVDGVAELTLGGILERLREIGRSDRSIRAGEWQKPMGSLLKGKSIGIVGLGRVGKRLAELLQPFETAICAYDPFPDYAFAEKYGLRFVSLNELLSSSQIVSLHLPYTAENKHLIGEREFELMAEDVILVNASRGGLIDEAALYTFLSNHTKASAFIDTFEQEPYSGPLSTLNNITLTAHIGSYAKEVRLTMEMEAATKIAEFYNSL